jgi:hypothetical protein
MSLINYGKIIDFYRETLLFIKTATNILNYYICVIAKWS